MANYSPYLHLTTTVWGNAIGIMHSIWFTDAQMSIRRKNVVLSIMTIRQDRATTECITL